MASEQFMDVVMEAIKEGYFMDFARDIGTTFKSNLEFIAGTAGASEVREASDTVDSLIQDLIFGIADSYDPSIGLLRNHREKVIKLNYY